MNRAVMYGEALSYARRGPALAVVAIIVVAFLYSGWSGDRWRDTQSANLLVYESQAQAALDEFRGQLADIESGAFEPTTYDANPMSILIPAPLYPASLGDFAIGHQDLHPASADLSTWRNLSSVFGRYQFDNPTTLATGSFDVAMVVIVIVPLLMIAVSFDVLASDRSRGSLALILVAPISMRELVWTRLLYRNGIIWTAAIVIMLILGFVNDSGGDRFERLGTWLGISLLYFLVWFSMIAFCVARFRSATATAGSLVALWLLFTLAVPATAATLSEALYPTPSRLAFLSEIRTAEGDTSRNLADVTEGYLFDHPDLTVGDEGLPSYLRAAFLSNEAALENTRAIVEGYEAARAGRNRTIGWAQYLSPSIVAQRLLHKSAGADLARQHRFQSQVHSALGELGDAIGPAVVSRNRLTVSEFDQLEPFAYEDVSSRDIAIGAIGPGLFLLIVSVLLGLAANRRLDADEHAIAAV